MTLAEAFKQAGYATMHAGDDPGETKNLAATHPEKTAELNARLDAFLQDTRALMPAPNPQAKEPFERW